MRKSIRHKLVKIERANIQWDKMSYFLSIAVLNVRCRNSNSITNRCNAVVMLWYSLVCCFLCCFFGGVRVSVTFRLTYVHISLVQFGLLSGHLLGNSCSLG